MRKKAVFLLAAAICLCLLTGCGTRSMSAQNSRSLLDGARRTVQVPQKVGSVVCVGVGALRYTCYLQAVELVVGVEDYELEKGLDRLYSYVNYHRLQGLPVIGSNGVPYPEQIIAVAPQVIVMSKAANIDADALQEKTGIPVVVIPGSDGVLDQDAYETIRLLGQLYGREERARQLDAYLKGLQSELDHRTGNIPQSSKPRVYVGGVSFRGLHGFEGTEAGYGPFQLIHANNLADTTGQSGAFDIDPEQVLSWDPDILFLDHNGMALIREDYARDPDYYNALTAVKTGRVYSQISFRSYATNLDTALADAYYAASVIYPEQFADIDPVEKAGEIFEMLLGADPYGDLKEAGYEFCSISLGK